jgi:heavy metal sensor kinase
LSLPLRARLTLWYTAVLTLTLAAAAISFYLVQWRLRLDALDADLDRVRTLVSRKVVMELSEEASLVEAASDALEDVSVPELSIAIFDGSGALLAGRWDLPPLDPSPAWTGSVRTAGAPFRVSSERHGGAKAFVVGAAIPLAPVERELALLRRALTSGAAVALALAAAGGWWIARGALTPLVAMAHLANSITDRTPGTRLSAPNASDELGRLAHAFNGLLGRLESAFASQRRFMADASHELRTPISIVRTAADVTLGAEERSPEEYRDALGVVARQGRRLARMVGDMFLLARADVAGLRLERAPLYLDELVTECVRDASVLGTTRSVRLESQETGDLPLDADERMIRQLLMNLLDNAIRHTPPDGRVRVQATTVEQGYELLVIDGGPGVPEADRERIFERFVRLDATDRTTEGAGLGLPIARAIAEAHGGSLVLGHSDAAGSTFRLNLPRS